MSEGCLTVEMEASALFAVGEFRKVHFGQILYGGDDVSGINGTLGRQERNAERLFARNYCGSPLPHARRCAPDNLNPKSKDLNPSRSGSTGTRSRTGPFE